MPASLVSSPCSESYGRAFRLIARRSYQGRSGTADAATEAVDRLQQLLAGFTAETKRLESEDDRYGPTAFRKPDAAAGGLSRAHGPRASPNVRHDGAAWTGRLRDGNLGRRDHER